MKPILSVFLVALLLVLTAGCTEETLTSPLEENASTEAAPETSALRADRMTPRVLLRDAHAQTSSTGGFASPLFGLGTAPNGAIFVADAGAGIANRNGTLGVFLPGVSAIGPLARRSGWAATGAGGDPTTDTGQGLYAIIDGQPTLVANLFAFEAANDPDGAGVDSNPFDVAPLGVSAALVADPGANALLRVNRQGNVHVLAVFPDELASTANVKELFGCPNGPPDICGLPPMIPAQAVPTSVAIGPDGNYYVGELKGFPAPTDESNIWRVSPHADGAVCGSSPDCVKVADGGFTSIIDLAFGPGGTLYVAELDEQSWFAVEVLGGGAGGTINSCSPASMTCSEVATGIPILTAITRGNDGTLWATQNALIPDLAEVISIPQ